MICLGVLNLVALVLFAGGLVVVGTGFSCY